MKIRNTALVLTMLGLALLAALAQNSPGMAVREAEAYIKNHQIEVEVLGSGEYQTAYVQDSVFDEDPTLQVALEILETQANWEVVITP